MIIYRILGTNFTRVMLLLQANTSADQIYLVGSGPILLPEFITFWYLYHGIKSVYITVIVGRKIFL